MIMVIIIYISVYTYIHHTCMYNNIHFNRLINEFEYKENINSLINLQ